MSNCYSGPLIYLLIYPIHKSIDDIMEKHNRLSFIVPSLEINHPLLTSEGGK